MRVLDFRTHQKMFSFRRRVLAISMDGVQIWQSASVPGEGAGSPQASNDGRHLAVTHNSNQKGHFSIFDVKSDSNEPIYQYQSTLIVFDATTPFSAVGYVKFRSSWVQACLAYFSRRNFFCTAYTTLPSKAFTIPTMITVAAIPMMSLSL